MKSGCVQSVLGNTEQSMCCDQLPWHPCSTCCGQVSVQWLTSVLRALPEDCNQTTPGVTEHWWTPYHSSSIPGRL